MNKKTVNWLKVFKIIIIILVILVAIYLGVNEYKTSLGSSEKLFNYNNYKTAIRIKNNNIDTILLINKNVKVSNLILINNESSILYNQDIEEQTLKKSINKILLLFKNNNDLTTDITIINYKDEKIANKVTKYIKNELIKNNLTLNILNKTSSLEELSDEFDIKANSEKEILETLYYKAMDAITKSKKEDDKDQESIDNNNYKSYADTVYKKLRDYQTKNNIKNQDKNENTIKIELIPADVEQNIYPDMDSWYYIKDEKIYAYIRFKNNDQTIDFCYNGDIEKYKEGVCE